MRDVDFKARNEMCKMFAKAMNKKVLADHITIRSKEIFGLEYLQPHVLHNLHPRLLKSSGGRPRITYDVYQDQTNNIDGQTPSSNSYFCPTGMLCQRIVREPFMIAKSKSQQRKYWYNIVTRQSVFECPKEAFIGFQSAFCKR